MEPVELVTMYRVGGGALAAATAIISAGFWAGPPPWKEFIDASDEVREKVRLLEAESFTKGSSIYYVGHQKRKEVLPFLNRPGIYLICKC